MKFTVFGANGFIGGKTASHLRLLGHDVNTPERDTMFDHSSELGHVIYAIGLTASFRTRPHETIDAHVGVLSKLLKHSRFDSWLYLSSTRVYGGLGPNGNTFEEAHIPVRPSADSLYDLSKLLGESLCLAHPASSVRVARLSNVYGVGQSETNFLGSLIKDIRQTGTVLVRESNTSSKDYVSIEDVVSLLEKIARAGRRRVYNIGSGKQTTHAELAGLLKILANANVVFEQSAPERIFPRINIESVANEFQYRPASLKNGLESLFPASPLT